MNFDKYLVSEGEDKTATWSKKFKQLEYWTSSNTLTTVSVDTKQKANAIIKNSNIKQKLKTV